MSTNYVSCDFDEIRALVPFSGEAVEDFQLLWESLHARNSIVSPDLERALKAARNELQENLLAKKANREVRTLSLVHSLINILSNILKLLKVDTSNENGAGVLKFISGIVDKISFLINIMIKQETFSLKCCEEFCEVKRNLEELWIEAIDNNVHQLIPDVMHYLLEAFSVMHCHANSNAYELVPASFAVLKIFIKRPGERIFPVAYDILSISFFGSQRKCYKLYEEFLTTLLTTCNECIVNDAVSNTCLLRIFHFAKELNKSINDNIDQQCIDKRRQLFVQNCCGILLLNFLEWHASFCNEFTAMLTTESKQNIKDETELMEDSLNFLAIIFDWLTFDYLRDCTEVILKWKTHQRHLTSLKSLLDCASERRNYTLIGYIFCPIYQFRCFDIMKQRMLKVEIIPSILNALIRCLSNKNNSRDDIKTGLEIVLTFSNDGRLDHRCYDKVSECIATYVIHIPNKINEEQLQTLQIASEVLGCLLEALETMDLDLKYIAGAWRERWKTNTFSLTNANNQASINQLQVVTRLFEIVAEDFGEPAEQQIAVGATGPREDTGDDSSESSSSSDSSENNSEDDGVDTANENDYYEDKVGDEYDEFDYPLDNFDYVEENHSQSADTANKSELENNEGRGEEDIDDDHSNNHLDSQSVVSVNVDMENHNGQEQQEQEAVKNTVPIHLTYNQDHTIATIVVGTQTSDYLVASKGKLEFYESNKYITIKYNRTATKAKIVVEISPNKKARYSNRVGDDFFISHGTTQINEN